MVHQQNHRTIDHQQPQAQGNDGNWKRDDLNDGFYDSVDQTQQNGHDDGIFIVGNRDAREEPGQTINDQGIKQDLKNDLHCDG